jgi:anti-sigma factor RsiW
VSCREFVSLFLDAWLAGELPARRQQDCTAHVHGCSDCAHHAAGYRDVVEALRALRELHELPQVSEEFVRATLHAVGSTRL